MLARVTRRPAKEQGIRFFNGSLRTPDGRTFTDGPAYLDHATARAAATRMRVLVHWYHEPVEEITSDPKRIDEELRDLREEPVLLMTTATVYSNGADAFLVFERHH